jgi:sensor histidine kinase YesM
MPPMILQPLVENAAIHGIGQKETGGTIKVTVKRVSNAMNLIVEDDGVGMDKASISKILNESIIKEKSDNKSGHTTGIGTHNVIHRLKLFYHVNDVIKIESVLNQMTKITLTIPVDDKTYGGLNV